MPRCGLYPQGTVGDREGGVSAVNAQIWECEMMAETLGSKTSSELVNMFEDTNPLQNESDIDKRKAIMAVLQKRSPQLFHEWIASPHDSPRGYFLRGKAATAKRTTDYCKCYEFVQSSFGNRCAVCRKPSKH